MQRRIDEYTVHFPYSGLKLSRYVGETSLDPDTRFYQHRAGYKAGRAVRRFGVRVMPEVVAHLNTFRRWEAKELEAALAEELLRGGIDWVAGGH